MINEKELRTGNVYATMRNQEILVKGIDTVNKFVVIDPMNVDMEITTRNENSIIFEDLNPIELTSTRISQLGVLDRETRSLSVSSDKGAHLIWDEKNGHAILIDCDKGTIGQPLKYLHQLQNLYFFLTGKELPLY